MKWGKPDDEVTEDDKQRTLTGNGFRGELVIHW